MSEQAATPPEIRQPYGNASGGMPSGLWEPPRSVPHVRSIGISILLYFVTFGIYGFFWLYFIHSENPRRKDIDPTPGKAVGFLFIPFFNIYWFFKVFLSLTDRLNTLAVEGTGDSGPPINRGLCIAMLVLHLCGITIPVAGIFAGFAALICGIIWWVSVQQTANRLTEASLPHPGAS